MMRIAASRSADRAAPESTPSRLSSIAESTALPSRTGIRTKKIDVPRIARVPKRRSPGLVVAVTQEAERRGGWAVLKRSQASWGYSYYWPFLSLSIVGRPGHALHDVLIAPVRHHQHLPGGTGPAVIRHRGSDHSILHPKSSICYTHDSDGQFTPTRLLLKRVYQTLSLDTRQPPLLYERISLT